MKPHEVQVDCDPTKIEHVGKPKHFDPDHYLDSVEQMIAADEVQTALYMLDHLPGYYRMHPYPRAQALKRELYNLIWSVGTYSKDDVETYEKSLAYHRAVIPEIEWTDIGQMIDLPFCYPRGPLALKVVQEFNDKGEIPFIWEMGPSHYWLPHGLNLKGAKFNYYASSLNRAAFEDNRERLSRVWRDQPEHGQKQIFVCFETIEHLWDPKDILHQYHRYGAEADVIMMSTPCGTLHGGVPEWRRDIGHLRTWTPKEFVTQASELFPGYEWSFQMDHMMVIVGRKK